MRGGALATARPAAGSCCGRGRALRLETRAGNKNEGGLFAVPVAFIRDLYGVKEFNQLRGKAISLHSQARRGRGVPPQARLPAARAEHARRPGRRVHHAAERRARGQVITEFCKTIGADSKVRQGLIRVAKSNGGKLARGPTPPAAAERRASRGLAATARGWVSIQISGLKIASRPRCRRGSWRKLAQFGNLE